MREHGRLVGGIAKVLGGAGVLGREAPAPMNREGRREMRRRAVARMKEARAYVLLTFDGKGEPVYSFDVGFCAKKDDLRDIMVRAVAQFVQRQSELLRQIVSSKMAEQEQKVKVDEAKGRRSEELSGLVVG